MEALSLPLPERLRAAGRRRAHSGVAFFAAFGVAAVGVGAGRAITTSFLPVLLERIQDAPALIGAVMLVNAGTGFAVPLAVGLWSDRRRRGRLGRRVPFIVGGTLITSGGLVAIALGTASSYVVLALAAAAVYAGLNATTTAHRAIVVEGFEDRARPAATSAQEVAILVGGLAGVVAGGALIDSAAWLLFLGAAVALPLLAVPTVTSVLRRHLGDRSDEGETVVDRRASAHPRDLLTALRRPGAREVLVAQVLWVTGYAALPAFFVLYADHVLEIGPGLASLFLAGFGLVSGAGMLAAGRTPPERVYPTLVAGAGMLGGGLLGGAFFDDPALLVLPFAAAALGFGLVTALGFPYFARFVPEGQSGRYSGLYFSSRAIATTIALPMAGILIQTTGSYRVLLLQGAVALLALVPLARARERRESPEGEAQLRPAPARVAAVIPSYGFDPAERVVAETARHADQLVVVDDGSPPQVAERIDLLAADVGARVVRLDANLGKGDAVAAGVEALLAGGDRPDAIVVLDSDGQHPPDRIPELIEASRGAELVIGDRRGDVRGMPRIRRITNSVSSGLLSLVTRRRLPDTQSGMRLYRSEMLERVPLPGGRYEAEARHLKAAVKAGVGVGWVPIPAIYNGAPSHFRPVRDSARVLGAILGRTDRGGRSERAREETTRLRRPSASFLNGWALRLSALVVATLALGWLTPVFQPLDRELFLAINSLGDGPEWVFSALDPHSRNYVLLALVAVIAASLMRPRRAMGAAFAVVFAALFSDLLLQGFYLLYDRPRPQEVIGGQALLAEGSSWAHIASFPSGHLAVTTAMAVAAMAVVPALRVPLWTYVGAVALTRITFGAHFPLDVAAGAFFGYEIGLFSAALAGAIGVLPQAGTPAFARGWLGGITGGRIARPADKSP